MFIPPQEPFWVRVQKMIDRGHTDQDAKEIVQVEQAQGFVFEAFGYPVNIKDIAWAVILVKLAKTPDGQDRLIKMLGILQDMMKSIAQTAHPDNRTTSYGSLFLQGLVLRRFGLITDSDFGGFIAGLSATNTAEVGVEVMDAFPVQFKMGLGVGKTPVKASQVTAP
jgi:dTDP-4-amino-4,6-dideoxygalactose transaminase